MPYIIILNHFEGVDLIINALRATRNIAAADLADGIEKHTLYQDETGKLTKLMDLAPKGPKLRVV